MSDSVPTRGAHQSSPECVELKPPAGHRRIAVVKYSSSVPGGTLSPPPTLLYSTLLYSPSLLTEACCFEPRQRSSRCEGLCEWLRVPKMWTGFVFVCLFVFLSSVLFDLYEDGETWLRSSSDVSTTLMWGVPEERYGLGFFLFCFFGLHSPTHPHISSLPFSQLINCGEYPVCMHDLVNLLLSLKINVYPGVRLPDVSPTRLRSVIKNNAT